MAVVYAFKSRLTSSSEAAAGETLQALILSRVLLFTDKTHKDEKTKYIIVFFVSYFGLSVFRDEKDCTPISTAIYGDE